MGGVFSGEANGNGTDAKDNITAAAVLGINLESNLTGNDLLRARLEASNFEGYAGRFNNNASFNGLDTDYDDNSNDTVRLDELYYQRKLGAGQLTVGTHGVDIDDVAGTADAPSGQYAFIEQFQANPAIANAASGAGIGYKLGLGENLEVAAAYTLPTTSAATTNDGLFGGTNTATAKVTYTPGDRTALSLAYARTSQQGVASGTSLAADPFGNGDANGNNISLAASRSIGRVDLSAHGGLSFLEDGSSDNSATVANWAAQVGVQDLFGEGNYGGIGIGAVPYVTGGDVGSQDAPLAAQAFYSLKVSDGLAVQPQLVYISNPNGNSGNSNVWAGSVKTTLRF
ncbi:MAG: carbohydrate porin [Synechococcales cyanobacterium RM1_1_8]|nr:carbohydrate porin [Synechococcales cyanobacterium RM1_1_8]